MTAGGEEAADDTPPCRVCLSGLEEVRELGRQGARPRDHDQSLGGIAEALRGTDDMGWMTPF